MTLAGRPLALTRREYDLLAHLAAAPGRVFTKQELLESIWSKPIGGAAARCLDAQVAACVAASATTGPCSSPSGASATALAA